MPTAVRRSIIALLLLVAIGGVIGVTHLSSSPSQPVSGIIESTTPADGDNIPQQGTITIDLQSGWDGSLNIDQVNIPDNQLIKVPEQGLITFQPGAGKALEYFPAGQNCAILTYWQSTVGPEESFTHRWCFTSI
jgi:hypothetical protein